MAETPLFKIIPNEQSPKVNGKVYPEKDKELILSLLIYTKNLPDCVGLAANQVAYKGKRIRKRFFLMTDGKEWYPILNPKVKKLHGSPVRRIEGCKTWPDKAISALRYLKVTLSYQDHKGTKHTHLFVGYGAQIVQHEMGHLDGIEEIFTNKMIKDITGRNDKCPCGSNRKYKHCCINK